MTLDLGVKGSRPMLGVRLLEIKNKEKTAGGVLGGRGREGERSKQEEREDEGWGEMKRGREKLAIVATTVALL